MLNSSLPSFLPWQERDQGETATLLADLAKDNFQMSYLKWVSASNDADVFAPVFSTKRIPPNGPNRSRYRNPKLDDLTDANRAEMNQTKRKEFLASPAM